MGEGVEDVDDRHDPARERDLVAAQPVGVSRDPPISACAFIASNSSRVSGPALNGMESAMPIFPTSCRGAAELEEVHRLVRQADPPGDERRGAPDAARVAVRAVVAELCGDREHHQRLVPRGVGVGGPLSDPAIEQLLALGQVLALPAGAAGHHVEHAASSDTSRAACGSSRARTRSGSSRSSASATAGRATRTTGRVTARAR